jgi:hypothetical protein
MRKRPPQADSEPAQPMLPAVNLARCLMDDEPCQCTCERCPPWDHTHGECRQHVTGSCEFVDPKSAVPPKQ